MSQNKTCPVCSKINETDSLTCTACGTKYAFCTLFTGENAYNAWLKTINEKKNALFGSLSRENRSNGSRLSVMGDRIAFCNAKTNEAVILKFGYTTPAKIADVKQVSLSGLFTVFLKTDGTLLSEGDDEYGQRRLSDLRDIVFVATAPQCTYAVDANGKVFARGITPFEKEISAWTDIKSVACSNDCIVGIRNDGTVAAAAVPGSAVSKYISEVNGWKDVTKAEITDNYIVAINKSSKVLFAGEKDERSACINWTGVCDLVADNNYVVGLQPSGQIILAGKYSKFTDFGRLEARNWNDIFFIACGRYIIAGLSASGELKIIGNVSGNEDISATFSKSYRESVTGS